MEPTRLAQQQKIVLNISIIDMGDVASLTTPLLLLLSLLQRRCFRSVIGVDVADADDGCRGCCF
jgi:hypothetical protein